MSASDATVATDRGSVERGIAGDYEFEIGEVLREAWAKTDGSKATFAVATIVYVVVVSAVGFVLGLATAVFDRVGFDLFDVLDQLIPVVIAMPMVTGISILGLRRSAGVPTSPAIVLNYFNIWIPILLLTLFMYLMVAIGMVLLVIPGIYLAVSYMMSLPLLVDKKLDPWQAMETSRKAVTTHWLEIAGLSLMLGLINLATILTLGIGLIWTIPTTYIAIGILYNKMFGIEPETLKPS